MSSIVFLKRVLVQFLGQEYSLLNAAASEAHLGSKRNLELVEISYLMAVFDCFLMILIRLPFLIL
jgi:hypothetical protein